MAKPVDITCLPFTSDTSKLSGIDVDMTMDMTMDMTIKRKSTTKTYQRLPNETMVRAKNIPDIIFPLSKIDEVLVDHNKECLCICGKKPCSCCTHSRFQPHCHKPCTMSTIERV